MEIKEMRIFVLILILAFAGIINAAFAMDDFGSPFANETPFALSDAPYTQDEKPWDVEPAAGDEETVETEIDLPVSEDAIMQLKALQKEHSNIIVDDLSP